MQCHICEDELIPGCIAVALSSQIQDCTCNPVMQYKQLEKRVCELERGMEEMFNRLISEASLDKDDE